MVMACVDVDYRGDDAVAACVLFRAWTDDEPAGQIVRHVHGVEQYIPGQFYRRELPCLLAVLAEVTEPLELVIVDGYVWLGDETHPGLGARLYEALGKTTPVVGVAKTAFRSARLAVPVVRGQKSSKPLFVTAAGIDVQAIAAHVQAMHGAHRIPTLLRLADQLCRGG
jgi:deoxyribonuclease V